VLAAAPPCAAEDSDALARAASKALEARRFGDALEAYARAATLRPDDAGVRFGAGVAAFMLGQDAVAQVHFESALASSPGFLAAAEWLGDLHYRAGRLPEAIAVYEAASRRSRMGQALQSQLDQWRRELALQSRFREVRTEHFAALFEADEHEPLARRVVDRLEAAYSRIGNTLGVYPSRRITAVLYTREQYSGITRLGTWSAAAYDGRIRVPLSDTLTQPEELDRVLSHELVHALVTMVGGRTVPAWMSEGLAAVLEPAGSDYLEAVLSRTEERPRLSKLHGSFAGFSAREADVAYGSAARAVRTLIKQHGVTAVVALLEDLGRGAPFSQAFQNRLGIPYAEFADRVQ
jgi:tetratricopeptide (TPR) repeat protein